MTTQQRLAIGVLLIGGVAAPASFRTISAAPPVPSMQKVIIVRDGSVDVLPGPLTLVPAKGTQPRGYQWNAAVTNVTVREEPKPSTVFPCTGNIVAGPRPFKSLSVVVGTSATSATSTTMTLSPAGSPAKSLFLRVDAPWTLPLVAGRHILTNPKNNDTAFRVLDVQVDGASVWSLAARKNFVCVMMQQ